MITLDLSIALALLSAAGVAFAIYTGIANRKRDRKLDTKTDATTITTVIVKLDNIEKISNEVRAEMGVLRRDYQEVRDMGVKNEAAVKSAWRAIDELKNKGLR